MNLQSKLVDGLIPPYTVCPFADKCELHQNGCHHTGVDHPVAFSCAIARAFDILHPDTVQAWEQQDRHYLQELERTGWFDNNPKG